jgi:hypothetical protein
MCVNKLSILYPGRSIQWSVGRPCVLLSLLIPKARHPMRLVHPVLGVIALAVAEDMTLEG